MVSLFLEGGLECGFWLSEKGGEGGVFRPPPTSVSDESRKKKMQSTGHISHNFFCPNHSLD